MERPNIPPTSTERAFLATANYVFTAVFAIEMFVKVDYIFINILYYSIYRFYKLKCKYVTK